MLKARQCVIEMREYASPSMDAALELRLDLNENTSGCSPRVLARLRELDAKKLALYPPREPGEKLVAEFLGIRSSETLLTNGADEGIDQMCRAYLDPDDEMVFVTPAFSMYQIFCQAAGGKPVAVPAGPEFSFPRDGLLAAITPRTRMIVLTNPNNPTGTAAERADLLRVIEAAPDAAVLVDEAYFDFHGKTMMDLIGKVPNLFIARTFSKAYGLAGVRIGVLAGPAEQISVVRRMLPPYNMNVYAVEALAAALADQETVQNYVDQTRRELDRLRRELTALHIKSWPSETNFVLADFGPQRDAVLAAMSGNGVALRTRPDLPGCIRITIGTPIEMDRVIAVLRQCVAAAPAARRASP